MVSYSIIGLVTTRDAKPVTHLQIGNMLWPKKVSNIIYLYKNAASIKYTEKIYFEIRVLQLY